MDFLQTAKQAAKSSGELLKDSFRSEIKRERKKGKELVSNVDRESEKNIRQIIEDNCPQHSILGEELEEKKQESAYRWIIDPLDGTTNFFMANPFFNTSIALTRDKKIILGVVYNPVLDELFWAERGKGSFLNDKPIKVATTSRLEDSLITFCHGKTNQSIEQLIPIYRQLKLKAIDARRLGAGALELCYVASGRVDAFLDVKTYPWDVAAGSLIAKEAGAHLRDLTGDEWSLESDNLLATNSQLEDRLLRLVKQANDEYSH